MTTRKVIRSQPRLSVWLPTNLDWTCVGTKIGRRISCKPKACVKTVFSLCHSLFLHDLAREAKRQIRFPSATQKKDLRSPYSAFIVLTDVSVVITQRRLQPGNKNTLNTPQVQHDFDPNVITEQSQHCEEKTHFLPRTTVVPNISLISSSLKQILLQKITDYSSKPNGPTNNHVCLPTECSLFSKRLNYVTWPDETIVSNNRQIT